MVMATDLRSHQHRAVSLRPLAGPLVLLNNGSQQGVNVVFTVFVFAWAGIIVWLQLRDQRAGREGAAPLAAPMPLTGRNPRAPEPTVTAEP
jgi:hypothetical protein